MPKVYQGFRNSGKGCVCVCVCVCVGGGGGGGGKGVLEILLGEIFLPGEGNLRRSDFEDSNLFQS